MEGKIDDTVNLDERIEVLQTKLSEARKKTKITANTLHEKRVAAVPDLKEKLEAILKDLGLPNAQFRFEIGMQETFRKHGMDSLE